MIRTLTITKAREELPTLVDRASKRMDDYIITVNGIPQAIIMSVAEYESWQETNEILAKPSLMKSIKQGEKDIKHGKFVTLEELEKDLHLNT
jgi:antitoxin YefM